MKFIIALILLFALSVNARKYRLDEPNNPDSRIWAVLVAGSNSYGNYRHQSDICHAYHTLHDRGIPDEQIIVFMYDDIANSPYNPAQGMIFNDYTHTDVYAGVPKDYTGSAVTSSVFIQVINGINPGVGSGKILKSNANDRVFIFFDDHGGDGILAFPYDYLYHDALATALNNMYTLQLYGTLVFYVEACEAGSMFYDVKLPPHSYVVTASPILASSWAWQYDTYVNAYLSDVFAQAWVNNTDNAPDSGVMFQDQYEFTTTHIDNGSQPCQYGDLSIATGVNINDFFGKFVNRPAAHVGSVAPEDSDMVSQIDASLEAARRLVADHPTKQNIAAFQRETRARSRIDKALHAILTAAGFQEGLGTVATPCTTCDGTCKCISGCGLTDLCKFECCNIQSCFQRFSVAPDGAQCSAALTRAWQERCGNAHSYLRNGDLVLSRACRIAAGANLNVEAALQAIAKECPLRL